MNAHLTSDQARWNGSNKRVIAFQAWIACEQCNLGHCILVDAGEGALYARDERQFSFLRDTTQPAAPECAARIETMRICMPEYAETRKWDDRSRCCRWAAFAIHACLSTTHKDAQSQLQACQPSSAVQTHRQRHRRHGQCQLRRRRRQYRCRYQRPSHQPVKRTSELTHQRSSLTRVH